MPAAGFKRADSYRDPPPGSTDMTYLPLVRFARVPLFAGLTLVLRVRPETSSGVAEFSEHETDRSELEEGERCAVEVLPVLCQAPAAVEPSDGALDDPTPG